jgi:hypothetical protein
MDTIINQQVVNNRSMECPMIVLAQSYKSKADAINNPNRKFEIENEFRKALIQLPEYTYTHSLAALSYFFKNENNYTKAQKDEIVQTYLGHIISSTTPENTTIIKSFLRSLLPSEKRPGKLGNYPAVELSVQNRIKEL